MRALVVLVLCLAPLAACHREPAIVIHFDPVDARSTVDAGHADAANVADAGRVLDKTVRHPSGQCATDDDCTVVTDGCCDCANGGKLVAATKRVAAQSKKDCKDVVCTMMISTDPSCGKRPACIAGTCALRDARPGEVKPSRLTLPTR